MGIFRGRCTCQLLVDALLAGNDLNDACPTLGESVTTTLKPESVTVPNQPAGAYTMLVINNTDRVESCSYQVILTSTT